MTPPQKEFLFGWILAIFAAFISLFICLGLNGCAHRQIRQQATDPCISSAAQISDRIDDKAVLVERYLSR